MAVAVKEPNKSHRLPDYIKFLMSPDTPLDFHVNVGDADTVEKIGAVKWMLIARSKVMRVMLHESKLKHEGDLNITDLEPAIFKHFLVYIYGHDNTRTLPFEDAVKLLNVAEKYNVKDLKTKLGKALMLQVTHDNVFTIMRHAAICEKVPELWETVTKVIQNKTEKLFSSPQFQTLSPEGMLYILQQDCLSVPEIDVWRATLNWVKYQVEPVESIIHPGNLRSTLLPFLKHIRLCTITADQLCKEVLPTQVLTGHEVEQVGMSIGSQKKSKHLIDICSKVEKRGTVSFSGPFHKICTNLGILCTKYKYSSFRLLTKEFNIKLMSIKCRSNKPEVSWLGLVKGEAYQCEGKITITHELLKGTNSPVEPPVEINFSQYVECDDYFTIPLCMDEKRCVKLKAKSKYDFEISFAHPHSCFSWINISKTHLDIQVRRNENHCMGLGYWVDFGSQNNY